jgi:hypothetical protein
MHPVIGTYLDHPVVRYLIVAVFSTSASLLFFSLGGSLADISNNEHSYLGLSFKASGAVGGFVLLFFASIKAIERLTPRPPDPKMHVRVYLVGTPEGFLREGAYICEGRVFDGETGDKRRFNAELRWEMGFLTVDFHNVGRDDILGAKISDGGRAWQLDDFRPWISERRADTLGRIPPQPGSVM